IASIEVREGERVEPGRRLLVLERTRGDAQLAAAEAEVARQRQLLEELRNGARREDIAQARANLAAAQAQARDAPAYLERAALQELENGVRPEQVAQAEAALAAAEAQLRGQAETTGRLDVVAPRAGRVDSLPYRAGDEAPVGAPLAVLLVGERPYARIYVPEPQRPRVQVGQAVRVHVGADGQRSYPGRVRMVRSEPVFTPYYALTGKDAARLSYLAEVELEGEGAGELPAGLPLRVEFGDAR